MPETITMTRSQILDVFAGELRKMQAPLPEVVHEGLAFHDDLGLDSLSVVEFVARVEGIFRVEISDDELNELTTIGLAVDYVEKRLNA